MVFSRSVNYSLKSSFITATTAAAAAAAAAVFKHKSASFLVSLVMSCNHCLIMGLGDVQTPDVTGAAYNGLGGQMSRAVLGWPLSCVGALKAPPEAHLCTSGLFFVVFVSGFHCGLGCGGGGGAGVVVVAQGW